MQIILDGTSASSTGMWVTRVPPHQLAKFGPPNSTRGTTSILLVAHPSFDQEDGKLTLNAEGVMVLNLGTTPRTLVVDADADDVAAAALTNGSAESAFGPGDREYQRLVDGLLNGEAREVAHDLLRNIRQTEPGDLKRGERNNFSNMPDNFWYVIVQPRNQALSITVRGVLGEFTPSSLELAGDRPGYTRFQLSRSTDLPEALRIIAKSKRKDFIRRI